MVGRESKLGSRRRASIYGGASLAAIILACAGASPAAAQATPGSAECPVIDNLVTCSGNLPNGVEVTSGAFSGLRVSNVTGDMAATNRPVILYRSAQPNTVMILDDPDSTIRLTTTETTSGTARLTGAVTATLTAPNTSFSLTSNMNIAVIEQEGGVNATARNRGIGLLVEGTGGTFALTNSGDITLTGVDVPGQAAGIAMAVSNADLVRVVNSGDIRFIAGASEIRTTGHGIAVQADNRRVEIINSGDIILPAGDGRSAIFLGPDAFELTSTPGVLRPPPARDLESYRIVNSGFLDAKDRGIFVSADFGPPGGPTGEIVNNGRIRAEFGIVVRHPGDKNILNNGILESRTAIGDEFVIFQGITVAASANSGNPDALLRIENGADGIIRGDLDLSQGIAVLNSPATIINAGMIRMTGANNEGMEISSAGNSVGVTQIVNGGTIELTGANSLGIESNVFSPAAGRVSDTRISNSGTIAATGQGSTALDYESDGTLGFFNVDLAATSIIRGGLNGIRMIGGERHNIVNRGLLVAAAGHAIAGGAAAETVDNSGRIEGSIALAGGDDAVTMRAGAVQIGAMDGGAGNDALLFDITTGEAAATGAILNFESIIKRGAGTLTLRDTGTISPGLSFLAGTLLAEGNLGSTAVAAPTGTTFGGSGSVGAVTIADGATLSPGGAGAGVGTLTMSSLLLSANSRLLFNLGAPGQVGGADNDLINVAGNLTLDGVLDINPRAAFGIGVYRLINYGGVLTDNGLTVGTAPAASYQVQTSLAGQVNLVVGLVDDLSIQFWDDGDTSPDGVVDGGAGVWSTGRTNWTNLGGTANNAWAGNFAVFQNTGGAVTVEGQQGISGMQFMANGYRLPAGANGALSLNAAQTMIRVDPGVTAELALPITGTGTLVKRDLGTLLLLGTNSYSGGTVVREGVLRVATDGALGAAAGGVTLDGGVLRFDAAASSGRAFTIAAGGGTLEAANALTLSGPIGGTGALTKTGAGTLTLSGNSSAFAGTANIAGGLVNLTGSLGGSLVIQNGGRLGGTGTLGNLTIASGGILAPGGSPGTLNATGNVIFRAGSIFDVEIAAAGGRDLLAAAGSATIEGGTVRVTTLDPETQYTDGARYTFLTAAGGRTGAFADIAENSAFLDFILGYDATSAFLTVDVIRTFPDVAATFNQHEASKALMGFNTGGADALAVYNQLLLLDAGSARAAFDLASGEIYAVTLASALRRAEGEAGRLLSIAHAGSGEGWGLWGSLSGTDGEVDADGNGAAFSHDAIRGTLGADYRGPGNGWALGFGGGYWRGDATLADRASRSESEGWHLGGYARYGTGGSGFTATVSGTYSQGEAQVVRALTAGATSRGAASRIDADSWALAGEIRYGLDAGGGLAAGPLARIVTSHGQLGQFTETGAGSLNLSGGAGNDDQRALYGGGLFARWSGARGSVDLTALYATGGSDPTEVGLTLTGAAGTPFRVRAAQGQREGLNLSFAGRYELGGGWSIGGDASAFTGGDERHLTGSATINWRF